MFLVVGLAGFQQARAQNAVVRGFVTDAANGEALQGVNVVLENAAGDLRGMATTGDGIYGITRVPPGHYQLRASFIGFQTYVDTLDLAANERLTVNIELLLDETELGEIVVEGIEETGAARMTAGLQTVRPKDIELVPMPDVSGDLANFLTTLPGVVTIGDRGGQLFIRGGEPSHSMVLIDGMYVHQPYHILGFYSAFPSDIIRQADVYTAGYGAEFSGRIASVIDIHSRNGNKRRYAGAVSVAPFVSGVRLEGPLVKDRVSFLGSWRHSVIEQAAQHYVPQELPYDFGDTFGKIHAIISRNSQLSFTVLQTHDRGTLGQESEDRLLEEVRWKNTAYGLRYVILPRALPFVAEMLLSISEMQTELGPREDPVRWSRVRGFNYAVNMTNFFPRAEWKWGLFWRAPEITSLLGGVYQNVEFGFSRRHKAGIYVEPDFYVTDELRMRLGVIAQLFPGQDQGGIIEPRMRLVWQKGRHEISAAAGLYHQELFGLNDRRDATNVFTAWRSAPTDNLSRATHLLLGYRVTPLPGLEIAAEGFYKRLRNLFIAEWTSFPRFTTRLQRADGRVVGLDLRLEVRRPHFYGYINYGLASVEYEAKQASLALWYGSETLKFHPPHDRRHQLNVLGSTTLGGFDVSLRWNFGSGRPFNRLFGFDGFVLMNGVQDLFTVTDDQRVIYERPFQGRLPTYHRLDVSVERRFDFSGFDLTVQVGAINLYDRRNLFALDLFTLERSDQLPFVPTVGLKIEVQ
ncbi:MAG: carboxypeptidase regulatory-like domain-containing protein [Rhodothermales bacterium]